MTRDESVALANKLFIGYSLIERTQEKINNNETELHKIDQMTPAHYSAFRYFTPFFVASIIVAVVMLLPATIFISIFNFLAQSTGGNQGTEAAYTMLAIYIVVISLIHLIGGFSARKKSWYMNMLEEENVNANKRKGDRLREENNELRSTLETAKKDVSEFDDLIPSKLRTSHKMMEAKRLLLSGKAEDLADAVRSIA